MKDLEKQVATKAASIPADNTELKKLRTELADARAAAENAQDDAAKARKAAAKADQSRKRIATCKANSPPLISA